jgi:ABC-type branched-subunit amino acid transport system ATPase component
MSPPLLELEGVKVWFGGVRAVDGVDMRLEEGRLYGIIGPNGSGKTTLVNAISRLTHVTEGRVSFRGEDVTNAPPHVVARAGMARTFQSIRLLERLTVRENVLLGTDRLGDHGSGGRRAALAAAGEAADAAIERLGLQAVVREYPGSLPYGTQRRVEIARAVASGAKLLLLDEPIAGMTRAERDDIAEVLRTLRADGLTQVLIEHDLRMVLRTCDFVYVLNLGTNLAEGLPEETVSRPEVQEAYLGRTHAGT